jgi:hypothetical protein
MSRTPLIILAGADKGGVGKTQVCRAVCDYLRTPALSGQPSPRVLDGQWPKGDLVRFEVNAEKVNLESVRDQMKVFDALSEITVVDIAAGQLGLTMRAFEEARMFDDVRAGTLRIVLLHVLGPSISSISEIGDAVAALGNTAAHFIVKNHVNESEFFEWDASSQYAQSLKALEAVTINVPHLDAIANDAVQAAGGTFVAYAGSNASRVLRGRVAKWLERTWLSFDQVGLGKLIAATTG